MLHYQQANTLKYYGFQISYQIPWNTVSAFSKQSKIVRKAGPVQENMSGVLLLGKIVSYAMNKESWLDPETLCREFWIIKHKTLILVHQDWGSSLLISAIKINLKLIQNDRGDNAARLLRGYIKPCLDVSSNIPWPTTPTTSNICEWC